MCLDFFILGSMADGVVDLTVLSATDCSVIMVCDLSLRIVVFDSLDYVALVIT